MRDIFGIAVAVVIAGLSQIVQPWSAWWNVGMTIAALIAIGTGIDLLCRAIREKRPASSMTAADVGLWTTLGATLVCAFYAALGYHRPKAASPPQPPEAASEGHVADPNSNLAKPSKIPIVAMLVAVIAAAFTIIDRHWFPPQGPTIVERPASADDALLDIQQWQKGVPSADLPRYFANILVVNSGKSTALGMQHLGVVAYAEGGIVDGITIATQFLSLRTQLKLTPYVGAGEIRPGNNQTWFSVIGPPVKDDVTKRLADGTDILYVFNIIRYKDDRIDSAEFIYSENCAYFIKDVVHFCESGPNRTYISN